LKSPIKINAKSIYPYVLFGGGGMDKSLEGD
jgi:hypothetical protein